MSGVLADYAKFRVYGGSICAIVISLSLIFAGIMIVRQPKIYTKSTDAKVTKATPTTVTLSYLGHTSIEIPNTKNLKVDQTIKVYYDPKNIENCVLDDPKYNTGWIFLGVGILISVVSSSTIAVFSSTSNDTKAVIGGVVGASNAAGVAERVLFRD
jgi:hypothetical protein